MLEEAAPGWTTAACFTLPRVDVDVDEEPFATASTAFNCGPEIRPTALF